jgi:hypothetical protein
MKKFLLFLFLPALGALVAYGQNDPNVPDKTTSGPEKKCCFRIASISLVTGFNGYREAGGMKGKTNFMDFEQDENFNNSGGMGPWNRQKNGGTHSRDYLYLEMGLQPYSKKSGDYNKKRELVIGIYYSGSDLLNKTSEDFSTLATDTFSYHSGLFQTDTIMRTRHTYREQANVLGVNVKYLYKTDPERRFSLFTGYGLGAGFTLDARSHETLSTDRAALVSFYNAEDLYKRFDEGVLLSSERQEVHKDNDKTIFASVYVPFGVNLRLCKKKDIWNQMNLFMRGDLGLEANIQLRHDVRFDPYMGCNIGFRFDFR